MTLKDYADEEHMTVPWERSKTILMTGGHLDAEDGSGSLRVGHELQIVGRARGSGLFVNDETVSLVHAELRATPRGVQLKDRSSRNGTFVAYNGGDEMQVGEAYLVGPCTVRFAAKRFRFVPELQPSVAFSGTKRLGGLIGTTPEMLDLFARIERHSVGHLSVFIGGETGTGKERVARAIHDASLRRTKPFGAINCAAVSPNCLESELFGHVRGAFTGAERNHPGVFVEADGGTLLFDEVAEMSGEMQVKLLRVLQEREVRPVGGKPRRVDVRTLFASHGDLQAAVNRGCFRQDLYFRMAQVHLEVPPLRDRLEDLPLMLEDILRDLKRPDILFDRGALEMLRARSWPGNVRELAALVATVVDGFSGSTVTPAELEVALPMSKRVYFESASYDIAKDLFDRHYYAAMQSRYGCNVSRIAEAAGKDRTTVRTALRRIGMIERT
jgi:DNA-binding NtrC family response regulator